MTRAAPCTWGGCHLRCLHRHQPPHSTKPSKRGICASDRWSDDRIPCHGPDPGSRSAISTSSTTCRRPRSRTPGGCTATAPAPARTASACRGLQNRNQFQFKLNFIALRTLQLATIETILCALDIHTAVKRREKKIRTKFCRLGDKLFELTLQISDGSRGSCVWQVFSTVQGREKATHVAEKLWNGLAAAWKQQKSEIERKTRAWKGFWSLKNARKRHWKAREGQKTAKVEFKAKKFLPADSKAKMKI